MYFHSLYSPLVSGFSNNMQYLYMEYTTNISLSETNILFFDVFLNYPWLIMLTD